MNDRRRILAIQIFITFHSIFEHKTAAAYTTHCLSTGKRINEVMERDERNDDDVNFRSQYFYFIQNFY